MIKLLWNTDLDPNQEYAPGAECDRLDGWSFRFDSSAANGFWNGNEKISLLYNIIIIICESQCLKNITWAWVQIEFYSLNLKLALDVQFKIIVYISLKCSNLGIQFIILWFRIEIISQRKNITISYLNSILFA